MSREAPTPEKRRNAASAAPRPDTLSPADRYAELFVAVQSQRLFPDSKTFVDCAPRKRPEDILEAYRAQSQRPDFDLRGFVEAHFSMPVPLASHYVSVKGECIPEHIDDLWTVLTRHPRQHPARSSLLQLPRAYVVPGGRFAEMYYWDSYFTMLGLAPSGRLDLLRAMTDNFAYLIDTYGFVPNGTRSYYLSRSQPPVFSLMVELCEEHGGEGQHTYLPQLRREHAYWMDGSETLAPGSTHRRVVRLADGTLLNRYWDDHDRPREESYAEDVITAAAQNTRDAAEVYRDLRAAAESGWDFSSRWLPEYAADDVDATRTGKLSDILTTSLIPVDLNALLYQLERKIADLSETSGDIAAAEEFKVRCLARKAAVQRVMWSKDDRAFFDFDWRAGRLRRDINAATVVPLFVGLAEEWQASELAQTLRDRLLAPGGLATSERAGAEQWDRPNGWAPLQWMAIKGLERYGHKELAADIAHRWLSSVAAVYQREGQLVEKYALREIGTGESHGGHGGEYPLQNGFGWTNGVTRRLLQQYPTHDAAQCTGNAAAPDDCL